MDKHGAFQLPKMGGLVSEADPDFERKATPEQRLAVQRSQKTMGLSEEQARKNLGEAKNPEVRAKFKIEVTFIHGRNVRGENTCGIQVWESGKRFHGGGDQLMFVCTDTTEEDPRKRQGCGGFIYADDITHGMAFCRNCKRQVNSTKLGVVYTMKKPTKVIAEKCADFFRMLGSNADLYLKFHKTDVRYIAMERVKGPEVASRLKGMHIYPLKNILKDTAYGSDLVDRFYAFLTS